MTEWTDRHPRMFSTYVRAEAECRWLRDGFGITDAIPRSGVAFGHWVVERTQSGEVLRINGTWEREAED